MARPIWHSERALREVASEIYSLRQAGFPELPGPVASLTRIRGEIYAQLGFRIPSPISLILKLFGLSPGEIKLWYHAESGWMTGARARPGARQVYRSVSREVAYQILRGELTHELEETLMAPETYFGE